MITIPTMKDPTTHCTDGLNGFPAYDFTGSAGEEVAIGESGQLYYAHLIPWRDGFGGWTFYFKGDTTGSIYFVTHLDDDYPAQEGQYQAGAIVGRLVTDSVKISYIHVNHVHVGNTGWPDPPGQNCGAASNLPTTPAQTKIIGVGVYIGGGQVVVCTGKDSEVKVLSMSDAWVASHYAGVTRAWQT